MEIRINIDDSLSDDVQALRILQKYVNVHKDQAHKNHTDIDWSDFPEYQRLCILYAKVRRKLSDEVCRAVGIDVG